MKNLLCLFGLCVAMALSAGTARAQSKETEELRKELAALRAELKALNEKIAKLTGDDGRLLPSIAEHEKKWVRELVIEFMREMLREDSPNFAATEKLVGKRVEYRHYKNDPNTIVKVWTEKATTTEPRSVTLDLVFDRYQIESEVVAPSKDELLIKGTLQGNKTKLAAWENDGGVRTTRVVEGELGSRTGKFFLRVAREKDSNRWLISYFSWSVDELKKQPEKK